jgi:hypothetical protein
MLVMQRPVGRGLAEGVKDEVSVWAEKSLKREERKMNREGRKSPDKSKVQLYYFHKMAVVQTGKQVRGFKSLISF